MSESAFTPGVTATISATTTTARAALTGTGTSVEIQNSGTTTVFVKFDGSTATATTSDYPVLGGQSKIICRDPNLHTHVAAITGTGTATVYATVGQGV